MLRRAINERMRASSANVQRLYDEVLLGNIRSMEIQRLLGHRLAFIPISPASLNIAVFQSLPREGVVFVTGSVEQLIVDRPETLARLTDLKTAGFRLALKEVGEGKVDMRPFLELAEFVLVDIGTNELPDITTQTDSIRKCCPDIKLVASGIQTLEDFRACLKLPFTYFQGPFITSREEWDSPRLDVGRIKIMELLNRLRREAEVKEIAALFKQDPSLSFRILRYINSPGMGLLNKVGNIEQAIMMLGQKQLYRWLTLLLFTGDDAAAMDSVLLENALVRARLAELIAQCVMNGNEQNDIFITGIFSLIDLLLHMPMDLALKQISLPEAVTEALLYQRGKYAPFIELAKACEEFDQERITNLAQQIGIDPLHLNEAHIEALIWAQQVSQ